MKFLSFHHWDLDSHEGPPIDSALYRINKDTMGSEQSQFKIEDAKILVIFRIRVARFRWEGTRIE